MDSCVILGITVLCSSSPPEKKERSINNLIGREGGKRESTFLRVENMRASFLFGCSVIALGEAMPPAPRPANLEHWIRDSGSASGSASGDAYVGVSVDELLKTQRLERSGTQWRWEKDARVPSDIFRHASVVRPAGKVMASQSESLIEVSSSRAALPAAKAKSMRQAIARKLKSSVLSNALSNAGASPRAKTSTTVSPSSEHDHAQKATSTAWSSGSGSDSSIVTPQWEHQKARFTEVKAGAKVGTEAGVAAGADPWWLNPPPWWLPPPPEWGSPPPSVYSPFYSPASIQQPFYNSPSHNSYPAYTPKPPPYRFFIETSEGTQKQESAYRAKRKFSKPLARRRQE